MSTPDDQPNLPTDDDFGPPELYGDQANWLGGLLTPHPDLLRQYGASESRRLDEQLIVDAAQTALLRAAEQGEDQLDTTRLDIAQNVATMLRQTLYFTPGRIDSRTSRLVMPGLEQISNGQQQANCYGFTLVASALLECMGVDHSIGFLNGHSVIILFRGSGERTTAWLVDPTNPQFTQDMAALDPSVASGQAREQMLDDGRAVMTISTRNFAPSLGKPVVELAQEHFWLMKKPSPDGEQLTLEEALQQRATLTLRIFDMERGRIALEQYITYRNAFAKDDPVSALYELMGMEGLYPEQDPELPEHRNIVQITDDVCFIIEGMAYAGDDPGTLAFDLADAIRAYFSSFGAELPPTLAQLEAQCYERLAQINPEAAERSRLRDDDL